MFSITSVEFALWALRTMMSFSTTLRMTLLQRDCFFLTSPFPETSALQHRAEAINSLQRRPERSHLKPETQLTLGQHSPALPPSGTGPHPGWSENTQTVRFPEV